MHIYTSGCSWIACDTTVTSLLTHMFTNIHNYSRISTDFQVDSYKLHGVWRLHLWRISLQILTTIHKYAHIYWWKTMNRTRCDDYIIADKHVHKPSLIFRSPHTCTGGWFTTCSQTFTVTDIHKYPHTHRWMLMNRWDATTTSSPTHMLTKIP